MAVYSPSDNDDKPTGQPVSKKNDAVQSERFYIRPSLGLKLWGPLVPASDNRKGLWTLVGIQTVAGVFCLYRFRKMVNHLLITAASQGKKDSKIYNTVKNIADIPTLNRFSTTDKVFVMDNIPVAQSKASNTNTNSTKFALFKKVFYLITGTALLSQSLLEFCRLKVLKYDVWYEEAKSAREKKFFNDIVKFYHEGIDPNKVKVKDAMSGNVISTNIPEVKQSVALIRAQAESQNPIIKWYGPIEFKPMSFSDYLDRLEYYLQMNELLSKKKINSDKLINSDGKVNTNGPVSLLSLISHTEEEYNKLIEKNNKTREDIHKNKVIGIQKLNETKQSETSSLVAIPEYQKKATSAMGIPIRGVTLDPKLSGPEDINIKDVWTLYDPWMNLGLDTSLSIKFIPTVVKPNEQEETQPINEDSDIQSPDSKDNKDI